MEMDRGFSSPRMDSFPEGLHVLAVDNDPTYLEVLEKMLKDGSYQVTKCQSAVDALSAIREKKQGFDIVMTAMEMPNINGLQLLAEIVDMNIDMPVILFSADPKQDIVQKGITIGACDFLVKPIHMGTIQVIWQHVLRLRTKLSSEMDASDDIITYSVLASDQQVPQNGSQANQSSDSSQDEVHQNNSHVISAGVGKKKPRFSWTEERCEMFLDAIDLIGIEDAVPKKIMEYMRERYKVPGLTRQVVSSHLQKFREANKKRLEALLQCQEHLEQKSPSVNALASPCQILHQNNTFKMLDKATSGHQIAAPIPVAGYISSMEPVYPMEQQYTHFGNFSESSIHFTNGVLNQSSNLSQPRHQLQWNSPRFGSMFYRPPIPGMESSSSVMHMEEPPIFTQDMSNQNEMTVPQLGEDLSCYNLVDQVLGYDGFKPIIINEQGATHLGQGDAAPFIEAYLQDDLFW